MIFLAEKVKFTPFGRILIVLCSSFSVVKDLPRNRKNQNEQEETKGKFKRFFAHVTFTAKDIRYFRKVAKGGSATQKHYYYLGVKREFALLYYQSQFIHRC